MSFYSPLNRAPNHQIYWELKENWRTRAISIIPARRVLRVGKEDAMSYGEMEAMVIIAVVLPTLIAGWGGLCRGWHSANE